MAGARVTYTVVGEQALKGLDGLGLRTRNLMPVMQDFAGYMRGSVQRNFDAQGRPAKWPPLKISTMRSWMASRKSFRTKAGKLSKIGRAAQAGRLILTDSTRLRNSIHFRALARGVEGYTNVVYAAIHHLGGMAGRGRKVPIPPRPYLLFQEREDIYGYLFPRIAAYLEGR